MGKENLCKLADEEERQLKKIERRNKLYGASEDMLSILIDLDNFEESGRKNNFPMIPNHYWDRIKSAIKKATE